MKLSINWLNEYVEAPDNISEFCDRLDLTGTGVEGVENIGGSFENIVTAQVIEKSKHPDSDHMWVCKVDVGNNNLDENGNPEPLQIVCGAQNFEEGDHIVTAMVGAELPGDFKIKKSKLRGVASCGMNCSERELGLGSDHDGIMILPSNAPIGLPLAEYLGMQDTVLDLEITPNRPDCLSITGLSREVGAMYQKDWKDPLLSMAEEMKCDPSLGNIEDEVSINIEDAERCPRYTARVVKDCKIGPSPDWMVERLAAIGQRSINNVVDVTNYILFLFGQPLHSFDLTSLKNDAGKADIVIRAAKEGEKITTLDGMERTLTPDMTVIATPEKGAVALAGVMGGLDTEVVEDSRDILIEAATFSPGNTSRTSRNLGLISESSMRYERRVDDHDIDIRSAAACALLAQVAGGKVMPSASNDKGIIDEWPVVSEPPTLEFRLDRFNSMMGADIPADFVVDILGRLGCVVEREADDVFKVEVPTFRPDLEREIDLYEEVVRLWGMDRIPSTLPSSPNRVGKRENSELVRKIVDNSLRSSGLNETMTYSFADPADIEALQMASLDLGMPVELMNPMNSDQSTMRQTMLAGLLRSVAFNQNHGVKNIQLYEIGEVFTTAEGRKKPKERTKVMGVLAGAMDDPTWNSNPARFDFFDGKGVLENLARELALPKVSFKPLSAEDAPQLQPGRAAQMFAAGAVIGWVGEVHPSVVAKFDAEAPVVAFEVDMDALVKASRPARDFIDVPVYPATILDQAFVVDEDVTAEKMAQVMSSAGGKLLESTRLFDVFRDDEKVGPGKKSMAFKLTYRSPERTLTGEEVDKAHNKLISKVKGATGAEVRS